MIGEDGATCDEACGSEGMVCDFTGMYELGDTEREFRMRKTVQPITSPLIRLVVVTSSSACQRFE